MTQRGAPSNSNISNAITWARSKNFDYVLTGQPSRTARWNDNNHGSKCIDGLGYISTTSTSSSNSGWKELLDGNGSERRSWPAANCPQVSYHRLISLCQDASSISNACVFDHRWRVGTSSNCDPPKKAGKQNINHKQEISIQIHYPFIYIDYIFIDL